MVVGLDVAAPVRRIAGGMLVLAVVVLLKALRREITEIDVILVVVVILLALDVGFAGDGPVAFRANDIEMLIGVFGVPAAAG